MQKQRLIMSNLVYGNLYPQLFCENHLKSLCDPTNLPALREKYDLEYVVFSDDETIQAISRHPNFMALSQVAEVNIVRITWPADADKFASRYNLLVQMFHQVLPVALQKNAWLAIWVADLVFAKEAMPRILSKLEEGHGAVFNVPIRSAADSTNHLLAQMPGAPTDMELFNLAFNNLHHLWVASHWDSPLFSKFPYSMLWNSGKGLCTHHFGITPIAFKPTEAMKQVQGVIDADVPKYCINPYWATDWTDAPVAGVEPLSNGHYPPFLQHKASIDFVCEWAKMGTMPVQKEYLNHQLFYPSRQVFENEALAKQAMETAMAIQAKLMWQA